MAESYLRQSPLDAFRPAAAAAPGEGAGEAAVTLRPRPLAGQLALRGDASNAVFAAAIEEVFGCPPPVAANTTASGAGGTLLWLGPDEWLAVVADGAEQEAARRLEQRLAGEHHAVVDVSSSRVVIALSGARAREVLMKGCSLDLHPRAFAPGRCDQASLARCHVLLHLRADESREDAPCFDVYVHRSFADYAWRWLADAGREYGVQIAV